MSPALYGAEALRWPTTGSSTIEPRVGGMCGRLCGSHNPLAGGVGTPRQELSRFKQKLTGLSSGTPEPGNPRSAGHYG